MKLYNLSFSLAAFIPWQNVYYVFLHVYLSEASKSSLFAIYSFPYRIEQDFLLYYFPLKISSLKQ